LEGLRYDFEQDLEHALLTLLRGVVSPPAAHPGAREARGGRAA
jgi:hypothetical protein